MRYIAKETKTIQEMALWLNGLMDRYDNHIADLAPDLCHVIVRVWDEEEEYV